MSVLKHAVVLLSVVLTATIAVAQRPKPAQPKEVTAQKIKMPKLKTSLGSHSDTTVTVSVDEANNLVSLPLIITDDKKGVYTIVSYQCMYNRKSVTEDEVSGKVTPINSIVVQHFKTTPISDIWKKTINEQLKPGEEIFFFDVVVKGADGKLLFAPNLKLITK